MNYVTKVLLACGLLLYAASVFLPCLESSILGGAVITYWSFKVRIYPYPYPHFSPPYEEMYFHSPWFVSQILTLLFGFLTLTKEGKGKYGLVFSGLTLLFSAIPIGACGLTAYTAETRITMFLTGFWTAIFAFLLLIASLLTSLMKKESVGLKSTERADNET